MTSFRRLVVSVLAAVVPVLVWLAHLAYAGITPDPMPSHWGTHGVDGTTGAHTYFLTILAATGVLAAATVAATWLTHSAHAGRMLTAMLSFGTWVAGVPYLESMLLARHIRDAGQVPMPWYAVLGGVGVPILIGAVVYALHGTTRPPRPQHAATAAEPLRDSERVTWIGHAHSIPLRLLSAALMIAAAIVAALHSQAVIPLGIAGLVTAWVSVLAVRVDYRGVHTLWGPFGWPRPRIAPDNIAAAYCEDIKPAQWGGWGYRISGRGVAAVIRGGPGLVIERVHGPTYAVTVDDADDGARVLKALLNREH